MNKPERCPKKCNVCKNNNVVEKVYINNEPHYYKCSYCGASTGVDNKGYASGLLATKKMRDKQFQCHELFDPIWEGGIRSRRKCYDILAKKLNIPKTLCHFSYFNNDMLDRALTILKEDDWYRDYSQKYRNDSRPSVIGRRGQYNRQRVSIGSR